MRKPQDETANSHDENNHQRDIDSERGQDHEHERDARKKQSAPEPTTSHSTNSLDAAAPAAVADRLNPESPDLDPELVKEVIQEMKPEGAENGVQTPLDPDDVDPELREILKNHSRYRGGFLNFHTIQAGSLKEYLIIIIGVFIVASGSHFFKFPNNFVIGGISGVSTIVANFIPNMSASSLTAIFNLVLLVIGYIFLGKDFGVKTAVASLLFSLYLPLLDWLIPIHAPLTNSNFLELCYAILLPAAGSALLFNVGASSGGTDVIAMLIKKHTGNEIGKSLFIADAVATLTTFFVFDIGTALMSVFGLLSKSVMVDFVIESLNLSKYFTIITSKPEVVSSIITHQLHRSGTKILGHGLYTDQERTVILCVVNRSQAVVLRDCIHRVDPSAFVMITNTSQIVGKGFRDAS